MRAPPSPAGRLPRRNYFGLSSRVQPPEGGWRGVVQPWERDPLPGRGLRAPGGRDRQVWAAPHLLCRSDWLAAEGAGDVSTLGLGRALNLAGRSSLAMESLREAMEAPGDLDLTWGPLLSQKPHRPVGSRIRNTPK